jgi:hypothetical protein
VLLFWVISKEKEGRKERRREEGREERKRERERKKLYLIIIGSSYCKDEENEVPRN